MAYRVIVIMQIHSEMSSMSIPGDVWVEKEFSLPFAPHIGDKLFYKFKGESFEVELKDIYYDVEEGIFSCYDEDKEIYNAKLHKKKHRPIQEIVREYEESGYRLRRQQKKQ